VKLSAFEIGRYEVTVAQFLTFVEKSGYYFRDIGDSFGNFHPDHPIIYISWNNAQAYISWLNQTYGGGYHLPTEAEWEYAARGGQKYLYAGGNDLNTLGWYYVNASRTTHLVGQFKSNGYGLYDMSGNVWEWCADWYEKDYYQELSEKQPPIIDPKGPPQTEYRVLRGGSWFETPKECRVSHRGQAKPTEHNNGIGFRIARNK
ncbi:MAG: formylglycine-generating enzyme family protein, partial [Bacteroidota bacterium]